MEDPKRPEDVSERMEELLAGRVDAISKIQRMKTTQRGAEIEVIMKRLTMIWRTFPQLRFAQLLAGAIPAEEMRRRGNDIFYIEDAELLRWTNEHFLKHSGHPTKAPRGRSKR